MQKQFDSQPEQLEYIYLTEKKSHKILPAEKQLELIERYQAGDQQARNALIKCNLRLVIRIARIYKNMGVEMVDMIQEGNMGLIEAIERFDMTRGVNVSTYVVWWIKLYIRSYVAAHKSDIKISIYNQKRIRKMELAEETLTNELGRKPATKEVADHIGLSELKVFELKAFKTMAYSFNRTRTIKSSGDENFQYLLVGKESPSKDLEEFDQQQEMAFIKTLLTRILSTQEQKVLFMYYGIDGQAMPTSEIALFMNLSDERIRQILLMGTRRARYELESMNITLSDLFG